MPSARPHPRQGCQGRVQVQQLTRLAPGPSGTTSRRGSPAASAAIPASARACSPGTAGRPGSPALARSPRRNARRPAFRIAQSRARPTPAVFSACPTSLGCCRTSNPRTRRQGRNQCAEAVAGGRAQRSQRIRDMGRLLEGAQCATGGEAFSRSQKRHISDEWQLSSPIKNNDEFLSFDEKIQSSRPLNSPSVRAEDRDEPSLSGCFSCSLASTDR